MKKLPIDSIVLGLIVLSLLVYLTTKRSKPVFIDLPEEFNQAQTNDTLIIVSKSVNQIQLGFTGKHRSL